MLGHKLGNWAGAAAPTRWMRRMIGRTAVSGWRFGARPVTLAVAFVATMVAVGLLAAGSDVTVPLPGDESLTSSADAVPLAAATTLLPVDGYEPTLAITPEGNLFYVTGRPGYTEGPLYVTGTPGEMWVYASYDQGASWSDVTPEGDTGEGIDPFIISDPLTGRVFRASYQASSLGGNGCVDLIWSDDEGATWTHNPAACGGGLTPGHDHESLATGVSRTGEPMSGYPNVLYMCVNRYPGTECASSRDGGESFGDFVNVYPSVGVPYGWCGGLNGPVATDSAGRVFVPRVYCGVPSVAISEDDGATWDLVQIDTDHPIAPSTLIEAGGVGVPYIDTQDVMLEADEADNLHAAWVAEDRKVWVSSSTDHGRTWGAAWSVDVPGVTAVAPSQFSLAAGAEGKLTFAFAATDHPDVPSWDGAEWDMYLAVTEDAFAETPVVQSVRANADDDPIGMDDCGSHRCTPCPDQDCGGWFDYLDVDIDPNGRPWAVYIDVCHDECHATGDIDVPFAGVATLSEGPKLRGTGALASLPWA